MKFIDLNKSLKEKIEPLYVVKGEDFYLIRQAINNIKSFITKIRTSNH